MEDFIKKTFNDFLKDYDKKTALKLLEISLTQLNQDEIIKEKEKEILKLKAENKALKQNKIFSEKVDTYKIIETNEVYFSQNDLELYLRVMYQNIQKEKYSVGTNKIAELTNLSMDTIKAIRAKLTNDGIIKIVGTKTEILKNLLGQKKK